MTHVRLLLDENLSEAILRRVAGSFGEVIHVRQLLGEGASDDAVWDLARERVAVLVTRDQDFERLVVSRGPPPKVIWIALHNASNSEIAELLRARRSAIEAFVSDPDAGFLALGAALDPGEPDSHQP
jgi:predicted nuclease of predicted toxin-antitoxin system